MDLIEAMLMTTASVVVTPTVAQLRIGHTTIYGVPAQPPIAITTAGGIHFGGATPAPPPLVAILAGAVVPNIPPPPPPIPNNADEGDQPGFGITVADADFPEYMSTDEIEHYAFV